MKKRFVIALTVAGILFANAYWAFTSKENFNLVREGQGQGFEPIDIAFFIVPPIIGTIICLLFLARYLRDA